MNQKHSVVIAGHATSISLEDLFWKQLKAIAKRDDMALAQLITEIDSTRTLDSGGLSSALRIFVLQDALK